MRHIFILYLYLSLLPCAAWADFDKERIKTLGLEVVDITTVDGELPTCDYVEGPDGTMGITSINRTKVGCRIVITMLNDTLYDSGEYEKGVSGAVININGNTSGQYYNKPYKIKLQKKADLLTRGDSCYDDKEWRLLKDAYRMTTLAGLKVNELMGMPWTPRYKPCNVFLNGDYQGCYLLIESTKRNSDCRLNVNKKTGYIIERDPYWWSEEHYFTTNYFASRKSYRWTWKYPDEEDVTQEQEDYIRDYINQVEKSIDEGSYEKYIDVVSFAKWLLAHDILGTWDSGGSNLYVMKYDNTEKSLLQMCNLWDFDTAFKMEQTAFSRYHTGSIDFYFPKLLDNTNKAFLDAYKQLWNEKKDSIYNHIVTFLNSYPDSEEGKALQLSINEHDKRWECTHETLIKNANDILAWFGEHWTFLEKEINHNTKIDHIIVLQQQNNQPLFNIAGQKVNAQCQLKPGIYISKGKKIKLSSFSL